MNLPTELMQKLGINKPIVLGPMLGAGTTDMVAAVTNSGGLGSFAASSSNSTSIRKAVASIREKTQGPFNINLFVLETPHPTEQELKKAFAQLNPIRAELGLAAAAPLEAYCENFREQLEVLIELKLPVVSFTFGLLDAESVERLHRAGSVVIGTATNVAEALAWKNNGADIICAQGSEAGGHRGTFLGGYDSSSMIGTMALVPQIVDAVGLPVIAAGGIMDGRGIAAALALGAQAVQMGTAFLVTREAATHPSWKEKIRAATDTSTRTTKSLTGRSARGIINEFMRRMQEHENDVPLYPIQNALTADIRLAARNASRPEYLSLWAGQAAGMSKARHPDIPIASLMQQLQDETSLALA
jgi:nitronate monooxygenase